MTSPSRNILPLLVLFLAALFLFAHFDVKPVVGDEGVLALDGWRMALGQLPQRDFFQFYPPLAGLIQAGAEKLFGPTVLAVRLTGALCGLLLLSALAAVAARFLAAPLARAVALSVLVPFGVGVWPFASHHWWVDIFLLAALLFLVGAERGGAVFLRCALAGGAVAWAVLTLQDQGGYAWVGLVAMALPLFPRGDRVRAYGGFLLGFGAAALPPLAFLVGKAGLHQVWADFVVFPLSGYHGAAGNRVGVAQGFSQVLAQWDPDALRIAPFYTASIAIASMVVYALPALAAASLLAAWRKRWLPPARLALLAVFCAAFLGAAFHRWSLMNLIWAAPLPAVAAALALDRGLASSSAATRRVATASCVAILVVFCGFGALRIRAVSPSRTHPVVTSAGTYRVFNPYEARDLQSFCDAVERVVPPGEPAFCFGFCPLLNFMTQHPNPTPFNFLITPHYDGPDHIARWVRSLEERRVRFGFGFAVAPDPSDPADAYLRAHYEPAWSNGTYVIWRRVAP